MKSRRAQSVSDYETWIESPVAPTLNAFDTSATRATSVIVDGIRVRRLTCIEGERLMGWPDDHTRWEADGRVVADSNRWRMIGNGIAAPVATWVAHQLNLASQSASDPQESPAWI